MMSQTERKRLVVMTEIKQRKLRLVEASQVLDLSYRQVKRIWQRFRRLGDAGLVHRARGRPSQRRKGRRLRQRVLARYQARYPDFGPTLAAEKLVAEGLVVDHETLRRWLLEEGLWHLRRRRSVHRQWRERKPCFGQMVQLDGSHHDWFEGREAACVLMVMVDDATNRTVARFFEEETTRASYDTFEPWVQHYGLPQSVYADRDSIYRCEGIPTVAQQLAGQEPQTQFGRAMAQLGVELILAWSPQAKGRVERRNGLLQDRLVKEMRLRGIAEAAAGNRFLDEEFLPELNRRFTVVPTSSADVHRPVPRDLDEILSWEEPRVVQRDWTVGWNRRWYQITRAEARRRLVGRTITVRGLRDGREQLISDGQKLRYRVLPTRPERAKPAPVRLPPQTAPPSRPAKNHPWRRFGSATGRGGRSPTGPQALRRGPRPGGRKASVRGGATPIGDRPPRRSTS
jgi:molybdenum-dependent DNA-binding transcriptional regulator ModE